MSLVLANTQVPSTETALNAVH